MYDISRRSGELKTAVFFRERTALTFAYCRYMYPYLEQSARSVRVVLKKKFWGGTIRSFLTHSVL